MFVSDLLRDISRLLILRKIYLRFQYYRYKIKYLGHVKFLGYTVIFTQHDSTIRFGKNVLINSGFESNLAGINHPSIIYASYGGSIIIGDNVGISGSVISSIDKIEIGNDCIIGANCNIIDNDCHPLSIDDRNPQIQELINHRPIIIGDGCFIGMNSIILKGTEIGKNCVVGAGSVVSGKWEDNSIIGGNPARFIKHNISKK